MKSVVLQQAAVLLGVSNINNSKEIFCSFSELVGNSHPKTWKKLKEARNALISNLIFQGASIMTPYNSCKPCNGIGLFYPKKLVQIRCKPCKATGIFTNPKSKKEVKCRACNGSKIWKRISVLVRSPKVCIACNGSGRKEQFGLPVLLPHHAQQIEVTK